MSASAEHCIIDHFFVYVLINCTILHVQTGLIVSTVVLLVSMVMMAMMMMVMVVVVVVTGWL